MRKFTEILAIAVGRKGSIERVEASIPAPLSPQHLSAVPGDRWLSQMTQNMRGDNYDGRLSGNYDGR
jgi:hypothetical protein